MGVPAADAFDELASGGLRAGPLHAWELVERSWPELERWIAVCLRALGAAREIREDCGQETLLRVWRTRSGYRGSSRGELSAWIFRICEREHYRLLEARGRGPRLVTDPQHEDDPDPLDAPATSAADPTAETAEHREALRTLSECVRELEPDARRVVELLYAARGLNEREVAGVIEVSKSQVNVLRQRALATLAACLRRKGVEA